MPLTTVPRLIYTRIILQCTHCVWLTVSGTGWPFPHPNTMIILMIRQWSLTVAYWTVLHHNRPADPWHFQVSFYRKLSPIHAVPAICWLNEVRSVYLLWPRKHYATAQGSYRWRPAPVLSPVSGAGDWGSSCRKYTDPCLYHPHPRLQGAKTRLDWPVTIDACLVIERDWQITVYRDEIRAVHLDVIR